jgi:membrane-associated protease RseP (regulator of RpoE activity)
MRTRPARPWLPPLLFAATCATTYDAGGPAYCLALMTILGCHEMGHFLQAMRYRVPASLPFFIPMPFGPIGTMGAVIAMHPGMGNRRALFDIAITGPLAGLVPSLICCWYGLSLSTVEPVVNHARGISLGVPWLFQVIQDMQLGPMAEGQGVLLHPIAFAGWFGLLLTALNLFPIGQLDGGHILYALLRRRARPVAQVLLAAVVVAVVVLGYTTWILMILLLMFMGAKHPPTANDNMPLGVGRTVLGWLALLFILVGFTPTPFMFG